MYTFFTILIIIVCVLLILIVLVQNPKGGGLSSAFGQGNQVMGVRKTTDFLEKATWTLAVLLLVLSLLASFTMPKAKTVQDNNQQTRQPVQTEQPAESPAEQPSTPEQPPVE